MLQPGHGGVQVDVGPVAGRVATEVPCDGIVRVRAGVPGREGVVEAVGLDDDLLVVGRLVVRNAVEARCKVDAIMPFSDQIGTLQIDSTYALSTIRSVIQASPGKLHFLISKSGQLTLGRRAPDREVRELAQERTVLDPEANTKVEPTINATSISYTLQIARSGLRLLTTLRCQDLGTELVGPSVQELQRAGGGEP